jgi:hypothetical protein
MTQKVKAKYKLKLNNVENLRELLQELYDESTMNITEIQNEINKLSQSTQLNQEIMDSKAKYAKAMNDFSSNKNKALGLKLDIAKMMVEIIKFNGNLKKMNEESEQLPNWGEFTATLNTMAGEEGMLDDPQTEIYNISH